MAPQPRLLVVPAQDADQADPLKIACPATHTDGVYNDIAALPEGARIQLDPAFNVEAQAWPRWEKTIAHALQTYGAYVGDTGGSLAIFGEANIDRGYDA